MQTVSVGAGPRSVAVNPNTSRAYVANLGDSTVSVIANPPPSIVSVSPNTVPHAVGGSITIAGTAFTGATAVSVGGVAISSYSVPNDTTINVVAPPHAAGPGD